MRRFAAPKPMPLVPPVTSATRPFNICISTVLLLAYPPLLAIDRLLHLRVVSRALDRHAREHIAEFAQVIRRELDCSSADVLLQPMQLRGARNRHDPRLLSQQPCQCNLGRCCFLACSNLADQRNKVRVGLPSLICETRQEVADVAFLERR